MSLFRREFVLFLAVLCVVSFKTTGNAALAISELIATPFTLRLAPAEMILLVTTLLMPVSALAVAEPTLSMVWHILFCSSPTSC